VYSERTMVNMLIDVQERAKESGVEFQVFDARGPNDFEAAFEAMVKAREDALLVFPSPMFYVNYRRLVDLAAARQLPTMYVFREAVQAGGLIAYGADIPDLGRRAALYVPWHEASALAHSIAGTATHQSRRDRACQQVGPNGVGNDGYWR